MSRELLLRYPLFALLSRGQLDDWLSAGSALAFSTGETIFQAGSRASWAYLVLAGRVRILRPRGQRELSLGTLLPGDLFGEYGLLPPHRNTVTCRASADTRLLRLPLGPLEPLLAPLPNMRQRLKDWLRLHTLLGYLRERAFLGFLSAPSALKFLDRLEPGAFRPLRTVQADGLGSDRWYVIRSGQVALDDGGGDGRLCELGPGDCFGARALLGRDGLPVAVALTQVECLSLARAQFAPDDVHFTIGQTYSASLAGAQQPFPWHGQREEADCGVAALTMLAAWPRHSS